MLGMKLSKIVDLTLYTDVHEGASCWSFIPVVENTEAASTDAIEYLFIVPKTHERLPEKRPDTATFKWPLTKASMSLDSRNSRSPWFVGSDRILSIYRRMQQNKRLGDLYPINMGIKTSKNEVYFVDKIEKTASGFVACTTIGKETAVVEPELLFPLVRGQDLHAWRFGWKYIILPHDTKDWKPIKEAVMVDRFPEGHKYLLRHRRELVEERTDYKPSTGPFYTIFRISTGKMAAWRVGYKDIGKKLEACVVPPHVKDPQLGERPVIIDHTIYFVGAATRDEAFFLAGVLNSTPLRAFSYCFARPKGGIPFRGFVLWVIGVLPIPVWNPKNRLHQEIFQISEALTEQKVSGEKNGREVCELVSDLDTKVGELYGLTKEDLELLGRHYDSLTGALTEASKDD